MTLRTRLTDRITGASTAPSLLDASDGPVGATLAAEADAATVTLVTDPERRTALRDGATTVAALGDAVDQTLPAPADSHS